MSDFAATLIGVSDSSSLICFRNYSEGADTWSVPRLHRFIPSAVSREGRNEELLLREKLRSIVRGSRQHVAGESNEVSINPPELKRWRITAVVVKVKQSQFVLDDSAFAEGEPLEEGTLSPAASWRTTAQVVNAREAVFTPDV